MPKKKPATKDAGFSLPQPQVLIRRRIPDQLTLTLGLCSWNSTKDVYRYLVDGLRLKSAEIKREVAEAKQKQPPSDAFYLDAIADAIEAEMARENEAEEAGKRAVFG